MSYNVRSTFLPPAGPNGIGTWRWWAQDTVSKFSKEQSSIAQAVSGFNPSPPQSEPRFESEADVRSWSRTFIFILNTTYTNLSRALSDFHAAPFTPMLSNESVMGWMTRMSSQLNRIHTDIARAIP